MSEEIYTPLTKADKHPLRYSCFQADVRDRIGSIDKHPEVCQHINDLYDLIAYQMEQIFRKEHELTANRHKEAWKRYDKPIENYDSVKRKFFTKEELEARNC
jgi:hypothetical protein